MSLIVQSELLFPSINNHGVLAACQALGCNNETTEQNEALVTTEIQSQGWGWGQWQVEDKQMTRQVMITALKTELSEGDRQ